MHHMSRGTHMIKYMYLQACAYEKKLYIAVEALKKFFDFFSWGIGKTASEGKSVNILHRLRLDNGGNKF
jgi:hypothetical protein